MMNPIIVTLFFGFLFAADYTMSKHDPIYLNLVPDPKVSTEVIYYDRIDSVGYDGLYFSTQDSVVNYYVGRENRRGK